MATALEQAFIVAVAKAASVRQVAYSAAFTTYGFVQANFAAYVTAIVAADVAYFVAVNAAATTAGISPTFVPDEQGVIAGNWASITA